MKEILLNRKSYLNSLIKFKDFDVIKVISGIRRSGKSSLMLLFIDYLKNSGIDDDNIIHINFESMRYNNMTYQELYRHIQAAAEKTDKKIYVFLDEIQKIQNWESAVNSMRVDFDCDIYITGSNAYLLSSKLSTYLSGRYVEIKVRPLSFREFLEFYSFNAKFPIYDKFNLYLKYGGMPGLVKLRFDDDMVNQMLEGIFTTVIVKDVIEQAEVRAPALLRKIARFLADNIGNTVSVNKIKNTLITNENIDRRANAATVDNYIMLLENAFVFYPVSRYDIKGKEYLKTQGKYYIADIGIRNQMLGYRNADIGHILENVVFLELLNRGYSVNIGKIGDKEVDFIAAKKDEKLYLQVTQTMLGEETRMRELAPLKSIRDNYRKVVLTLDKVLTGFSDDGIEIINLVDWLIA